MRIILDAMGGDHAPESIIAGAAAAMAEFDIEITLTGNTVEIERIASEKNIRIDNMEIIHTDEVITMEDSAMSVVREKNHSSMTKGLQLLADGKGDAFVSAGNTGALMAGATFIVRRIKGVRAAIATLLPFNPPLLLLDSGANIAVTAENLEMFARMGIAYSERMLGVKNPRVGLLNNGTERTKGTPLLQEVYAKLENSDINFIGNVEGKDVPFGVCDVLVTDGFTGNVALKLIEGMGSFFSKKMKELFYKNTVSKVSGLLVKKGINDLKKSFDASEYGGAPLLGIAKPVIKAHGSSDAKAIKNAIRQAMKYSGNSVIRDIAKASIKNTEKETPVNTENSPNGEKNTEEK